MVAQLALGEPVVVGLLLTVVGERPGPGEPAAHDDGERGQFLGLGMAPDDAQRHLDGVVLGRAGHLVDARSRRGLRRGGLRRSAAGSPPQA